MPTLHFTSSDAFLEHTPAAHERVDIEIANYLEATYDVLRTAPDGAEIARLVDGAWQLPDGRRFSDWAIRV